MSRRELVVLGSASQTPTRHRNHNGYLLRFDGEGVLFDPGEGTQRQMIHAGVAASALTRVCVTHFHGDHSLGLAGVIQRFSMDAVAHPVRCHYPASGQVYFDRLRHSTSFHERAELVELPVTGDGPLDGPLSAHALDHRIDCYGYRFAEPDGVRMLPAALAAAGPGLRVRDGHPAVPGRVRLRAGREAAKVFGGEIHVARDLDVVPLPPRR